MTPFLKRLPVLLVVLCFAIFITFLSGRDSQKDPPSPSSTNLGGLAAFMELLRRDGFQIQIESTSPPNVRGIAIVPKSNVLRKDIVEDNKAIESFCSKGGRAMLIDFPYGITNNESTSIRFPDSNQVYKINLTKRTQHDFGTETQTSYFLCSQNGIDCLKSKALGQGTLWTLFDGQFLTNSKIGQNDNAEFALDLVRKLAGPEKTITIPLYGIGEARKLGLLEKIGSWAPALFWQICIILLVVFWTIGPRFGSELESPLEIRGQRSLVDALGRILKTSKKHEFAAQVILKQEIEKTILRNRMARSSTFAEVISLLEPEVQAHALSLLEEPCKRKPRETIILLNKVTLALQKLPGRIK